MCISNTVLSNIFNKTKNEGFDKYNLMKTNNELIVLNLHKLRAKHNN